MERRGEKTGVRRGNCVAAAFVVEMAEVTVAVVAVVALRVGG